LAEKLIADCEKREVPVTKGIDWISFVSDMATVGDWNIQGLPTDPLSTLNGIFVTRSTRYPFLIDPQGQAVAWIRNKEARNLPSWVGQNTVNIGDPKLKGKLIVLHE
jgi:dynein heavy chain